VGEIKQEYREKIQWIEKRILQFETLLTKLLQKGLKKTKITRTQERIKRGRSFLLIYKEFRPQLNEFNYKTIQKLISRRKYLIELDDLFNKTKDSIKRQKIEKKQTFIRVEIETLSNELANMNSKSSHIS
jgi:hypothetical protein